MAENIDELDVFDDWMIRSMKSYKTLHMFELQQSSQVIEWIDGNALCVAGCDMNGKNEMLELSLPDKLLEDSEFGRERDFKVKTGGFTESAVYCLKHLPGSRLILTSGPPDNYVDVWKLGSEDNDVIQHRSSIACKELCPYHCYIATHQDMHDSVVMGSLLSDIQLVDVNTAQIKSLSGLSLDERITGLSLIDSNTCLACTNTGALNVIDWRINQSQSSKCGISQSQHPEGDIQSDCKAVDQSDSVTLKQGVGQWNFDVCKTCSKNKCTSDVGNKVKLDCEGCAIYRLNCNSEIVINDIRDLDKPLHRVQLNISTRKVEQLCIKCCPTDTNLLSISGFDSNIYIYDITKWNNMQEMDNVEPIFIHEGHMTSDPTDQSQVVMTHTWHPWQPHLLMSCASDGSLHAWQWLIP